MVAPRVDVSGAAQRGQDASAVAARDVVNADTPPVACILMFDSSKGDRLGPIVKAVRECVARRESVCVP